MAASSHPIHSLDDTLSHTEAASRCQASPRPRALAQAALRPGHSFPDPCSLAVRLQDSWVLPTLAPALCVVPACPCVWLCSQRDHILVTGVHPPPSFRSI